jgi:nucleotide-binding universal stress UspA family protein
VTESRPRPTEAPRVVVGVDGSSGAERALHWAADEAHRRGLTLELVNVWHPPLMVVGLGAAPPIVDLEKLAEEASHQILEDAAAAVRSSGLVLRTHTVEGRAANELVRFAAGADQLVVGERGHSAVRRLLVGSISSAVVHHATVPTTVVRAGSDAYTRRVVAGVDGSDDAARALARAALEADTRHVPLHVVGAWQVLTPDLVGDLRTWHVPPQEDLQAQAAARVRHVLERVLPGRTDVTVTVVHDEPVHALLEATRTDDLLVVGSRGLGVVERALLGSVASGVLHHASCPVQVVPGPRERW